MAEDKRSFVAAIRNTTLRRLAMCVVVPVIVVRHSGLSLPITAVRALLWAAEAAVEAFADRFRWEFETPDFRLLKKGLAMMWAKDWTDE